VEKAATESGEAGVADAMFPITGATADLGLLNGKGQPPPGAGSMNGGVYIFRVRCYGVRYIAISSLPKCRPIAGALLWYSERLGEQNASFQRARTDFGGGVNLRRT
jgi:hypothetical protein